MTNLSGETLCALTISTIRQRGGHWKLQPLGLLAECRPLRRPKRGQKWCLLSRQFELNPQAASRCILTTGGYFLCSNGCRSHRAFSFLDALRFPLVPPLGSRWHIYRVGRHKCCITSSLGKEATRTASGSVLIQLRYFDVAFCGMANLVSLSPSSAGLHPSSIRCGGFGGKGVRQGQPSHAPTSTICYAKSWPHILVQSLQWIHPTRSTSTVIWVVGYRHSAV